MKAELAHNGAETVLKLSQTVPPTPGQPDKQPMPIPLKVAVHDRATGSIGEERLIVLDKAEDCFTFEDAGSDPVLSINRGFSAPVSIEREIANADLVFLAARDDDPFARYEALQDLVVGHLVQAASGDGLADDAKTSAREDITAAFAAIVTDDALEDTMRGELMLFPSQTYIAEQIEQSDPGRIFAEREALKAHIGSTLEHELVALHERASTIPFGFSQKARGSRKVKTQALVYLAAGAPDTAAVMAAAQYDKADNMTDRQGALMVLAGMEGTAARTGRLLDFYNRYKGNDLVIDKWFAIQASSLHPSVVEHVKALADHPDFTLKNPNRVRSLYMAFAANPHGFHDASGEGYRMIADLILELDPRNPQTAARFVSPLGRFRKLEDGRAALMRAQLERIAQADKLSRDTYEQVTRSLG